MTLKGEEIATVRYDLTVTQDFIITPYMGGSAQAPGMRDARGTALHIDGKRISMSQDTYTLVLEDGREVDFIVTRRSGSSYSITRSGEFRDPR